MRLYIAGVNHFDPLGRRKLREWLKAVSASNGSRPSFVATEWDENLFSSVRDQRGKFRGLAQKEWPNACSDVLDALESSLGYEADCHDEFFPSVETLWLDQGRQYDVSQHAERRMKLHKNCSKDMQIAPDTPDFLAELSKIVQRGAQDLKAGNSRDAQFASLIIERIERKGSEWVIIIVGASHASKKQGTMSSRLQEQGLFCDVTIL